MAELKSIQISLQLTENLSCGIRYADDTTLIATIFELLKLSDDVTRRTALAAQAFGRLKD